MAIQEKTTLYVVCETEEKNDANMMFDCYISGDFDSTYELQLSGWLLMSDGRTFCPNCKKTIL